jgi:hypothetical protein
MAVAYNKEGVAFLVEPDGSIVDFNMENRSIIVGALATDKETIDEILKKTKEAINERLKEYNSYSKNNFYELRDASVPLRKIGLLGNVIEICNEAENLYYQISNPTPYKSWRWNDVLRQWQPPAPIPYGKDGEVYKWSDQDVAWVPVIPLPGEDWVWDVEKHEWAPMVKYPIDAQPGEFVWSDEKNNWVLANSQDK